MCICSVCMYIHGVAHQMETVQDGSFFHRLYQSFSSVARYSQLVLVSERVYTTANIWQVLDPFGAMVIRIQIGSISYKIDPYLLLFWGETRVSVFVPLASYRRCRVRPDKMEGFFRLVGAFSPSSGLVLSLCTARKIYKSSGFATNNIQNSWVNRTVFYG